MFSVRDRELIFTRQINEGTRMMRNELPHNSGSSMKKIAIMICIVASLVLVALHTAVVRVPLSAFLCPYIPVNIQNVENDYETETHIPKCFK